MKPVTTLLALPIAGPLLGLGWLARRVAEAADHEMNSPEAIEAALLALERRLEAGEIDMIMFEAEEALLLARLESAAGGEAAPAP